MVDRAKGVSNLGWWMEGHISSMWQLAALSPRYLLTLSGHRRYMLDLCLIICKAGECSKSEQKDGCALAGHLQHATQLPAKMRADGQVHGWRNHTNKVPVERYHSEHRPDAPVLGLLGCWIRAKLNAASRCDHWDAVMAVLVLRGQGKNAFLHGETLAYVPTSMSRIGSVSRQIRGTLHSS
jgi:hypothetical protein